MLNGRQVGRAGTLRFVRPAAHIMGDSITFLDDYSPAMTANNRPLNEISTVVYKAFLLTNRKQSSRGPRVVPLPPSAAATA